MERKIRTLVDIRITMLIDIGITHNFWVEAINKACYVIKRCFVRFILNKTPYELLSKRNPKKSYFKPFGCKYFVLNNCKKDLGKLNTRSDKITFISYSSTNNSYRIYNKRT